MKRKEHETYIKELCTLATKNNGWHFGALRATAEQITTFNIEHMTQKMATLAPGLWGLLSALTHANVDTKPDELDGNRAAEAADDDGEGDEFFDALDGLEDENLLACETRRSHRKGDKKKRASMRAIKKRRETIHTVVSDNISHAEEFQLMDGQRQAFITAILMITVNQKCNAFQSILGIFMHGTNAPEKVFEVMQRIGISISINAIHNAIVSLSLDAAKHIRKLGQTLLVAYAYDNFDVNLKSAKPTLEAQAVPSLKHLTSGLLFPLPEGFTVEDLKCSDELWKRSRLNDTLPDDRPDIAPILDYHRLLELYPNVRQNDEAGMSWRDRWNAWRFLCDLLEDGPEYFAQFRPEVEDPEIIEQVPFTPGKPTELCPARAMDISNSTVSGNLDAIANLLAQGGVGKPDTAPAMGSEGSDMDTDMESDESDLSDSPTESSVRSDEVIEEGSSSSSSEEEESASGGPTDDDKIAPPTVRDVAEYIVLFHGDLGTGERIAQVLQRRSIEKNPYDRYQFVIFIMDLFHLKMACADAVWRILILLQLARIDATCVMKHVGILRKRETGIIGKDPGFRRMHQVISHDGRCRRLYCWRMEVQRQYGCATLEEFALRRPSLHELRSIANHLAMTYVARGSDSLRKMRKLSDNQRDKEYENNMLIHMYYLLYEELSHAMNVGDIGRVELCFEPWILIFKAVGKHKYAAAMLQHLTNVHFFYPERLA